MNLDAKSLAPPPELEYGLSVAARLTLDQLRLRKDMPGWVSMTLEGSYPELAPRRSPIQQRLLPQVTSLRQIEARMDRVAADPRVRGLVLHIRQLQLGAAQLQSLRAALGRLRRAGKRSVAYATSYDRASYYLACAADEVLLQTGGSIAPLGLRSQHAFLADSLERIGLRFDLLQISPYKTAGDALTRRELSDEAREMAEWLLDDAYAEILSAICKGREMDLPEAESLVDASPYTDEQALNRGAIDGICDEASLPERLGEGAPAQIEAWDRAAKLLRSPRPRRAGRRVALIRIEGMIVDGYSEQPPVYPPLPGPFGALRAGDASLVQEARAALDDDDVAAAVVYIDSPGGSATASEAIAAALSHLARHKPVVAVMGSVAASGGYYVATPAAWILARPGSITGSIGVIAGKLVSAALYDRIGIRREPLQRGRNADFASPERAYSAEQRQQLRQSIERIYEVFLSRVAESRGLDRHSLDALAGGRVWTGRQARQHGLIDDFGGLDEGLEKACEMAGLHRRAPLRALAPIKKQRAPGLAVAAWFAALEAPLQLLDGPALCLCPWSGLDPIRGSAAPLGGFDR